MRTASKHQVPQWTIELAESCAALADNIAAKHRTHARLAPLAGLNMSYLSIVQSFELLDYYYDRWGRIEPGVVLKHGAAKILDENEQRVSLLQKSSFIMSMSSFEFSAKEAIKLPWSSIDVPGSRTYLGAIMRRSSEVGLIGDADAELWKFAVELRNCMVHNNAIAQLEMVLNLGGGFSMEMIAGQMTQSSPRRSILLQSAIISAYARRCDAMLSAARN